MEYTHVMAERGKSTRSYTSFLAIQLLTTLSVVLVVTTQWHEFHRIQKLTAVGLLTNLFIAVIDGRREKRRGADTNPFGLAMIAYLCLMLSVLTLMR